MKDKGIFTYRGICLDIKQSPYYFDYGRLKFFFTSKSYLKRFKEKLKEFTENENTKLEYNNYCKIIINEMLLIKLYKMIEKRDFYVLVKNDKDNYEELDKIPKIKIELVI